MLPPAWEETCVDRQTDRYRNHSNKYLDKRDSLSGREEEEGL